MAFGPLFHERRPRLDSCDAPFWRVTTTFPDTPRWAPSWASHWSRQLRVPKGSPNPHAILIGGEGATFSATKEYCVKSDTKTLNVRLPSRIILDLEVVRHTRTLAARNRITLQQVVAEALQTFLASELRAAEVTNHE